MFFNDFSQPPGPWFAVSDPVTRSEDQLESKRQALPAPSLAAALQCAGTARSRSPQPLNFNAETEQVSHTWKRAMDYLRGAFYCVFLFFLCADGLSLAQHTGMYGRVPLVSYLITDTFIRVNRADFHGNLARTVC